MKEEAIRKMCEEIEEGKEEDDLLMECYLNAVLPKSMKIVNEKGKEIERC
jgi:hypothetical protein